MKTSERERAGLDSAETAERRVLVRKAVPRAPIRERQREGIALGKQRAAYHGRKKTLTPERAAELVQRATDGRPKSVLARDYGISRETVYQYLRQVTLA